MFAKEFSVDGDTSARSFQGLLKDGFHQKGKNANWMKVVVVTHPFSHRQDLPLLVQAIQVLIFSVAHLFISILSIHICVNEGREQLWWLHCKFHYT